ncbi:MAG: cytochrome P450, partial [Solirubrobacterales bacterium]
MPQPLLGDRSVLLLGGREHLRQRRLLPPPFHGEWMQAYAETMRKVAERQVAAWPRGRSFAVGPSMQAITLEVILRTVFGINGEERVESVGAPLRRLLDATASQPRLFALQVTSSEDPHRLSPWGRFKTLVAEADRVVYEELAARRAEPGDGGHEDVLSLLLAARDDEGQSLTDLELRDELMTLLLAGHETTATALSWTLERLVRHPIVLDHLLAEHRAGDTAYLDAVIKESLRLRPAAASSRKPPPTGRKVAYMATFRPTDRKDGLVGAALVPRGMSAVEAWLREREVDRSQLEPRTLTHARIGRLLRGAPLSAARGPP